MKSDINKEALEADVIRVLKLHGVVCERAVRLITRPLDAAIAQQQTTDEKNAMHLIFKKMYKGREVFFREPVSKSQYYTDGVIRNEWVEVKYATLYHYQPRKKLAWLQLPEGKIKACSYRDRLQPMTLEELVRYGAMTSQQAIKLESWG
jgi:hypothetical protein